MNKTFAILGAGMQGTSAAYDLAKFGGATSILMADASFEQAQSASERVNRLIGSKVCEATTVNVLDPENLATVLAPADVVLSCVPYWMHPHIAPVAIDTKTHMVDMGGDTRVARRTLSFDARAKEAGVTIVPDTGLAPGLVNNLGAYFIETLDSTDSVKLYCGGLPQNPRPPFNYKLVFNVEGLVTEYMDQADILRDGKLALVPTLEELETITVEGFGEMEAFVTSGGTSTAPETYLGKVPNYEYKTIRFPGHCNLMKLFKDFGFWSSDPIEVRSGHAVPREVFNAIMGPALKDPNDKDLVLVRGIGVGTKDGAKAMLQIDIHQRHDDATGFTAMEQLTGSSTAIYAAAISRGEMAVGCLPYETAMSGKAFVGELQRRPINLTIKRI